jgi:hypothetical protein
LAPTPGQKDRYQGPDRREGDGLDAEACRAQARVCFAQAIVAETPEERERWMRRARDWRPRSGRQQK